MKCYDFEYDGLNLSNMGFVVCKFGSEGLQTVSNGSQITFNTVPVLNGSKEELLSSEYGECLETTFQICKNPCVYNDLEITLEELRHIMSWLNRKGFHKFKLLELGYFGLYFEASFNVNKMEDDGKIYGLELNVKTNRPYALHEPVTFVIKNLESFGHKSITDTSDEEGFIYPHMEIEINQSGSLSIANALDNRTMVINNCTSGEVITLDYPVIKSSIASHKIQNDFNWTFFRITNTFETGKNDLIISLPCTIKIVYSPIVKLAM